MSAARMPTLTHTVPKKAYIRAPWPHKASSRSACPSQRVRASAADISDYSRTVPIAQSPEVSHTGKYGRDTAPRERIVANPSPDASSSSSMETTIRLFFNAFNKRDLQRMADALADDVEHCNLAYAKPYPKGKQAVVQFYKSFVDAVPRSAQFIIEDTTGTNSSGTIGVIWHLEIRGTVVPNSSGVSFFRLDSQNLITYVRESPEHFTKITGVALPTLSMLSPLISLAEPLMRGNTPSSSPPSPTPQRTTPAATPPRASTSQLNSNSGQSVSNVSADVNAATNVSRSRRPRGSDVAMRPLGVEEATSSSSSSAGGMPPVVEVLEEASEEQNLPVQSEHTHVPVMTGATGAKPRVHNGCVPAATPPPPSVYSSSSSSSAATTGSSAAADVVVNASAAPAATVASGAPVQANVSEAAAPAAVQTPRFAGVWQKDRARCDRSGYERALELMGIGGIQKATALGLEGMEVQFDEAAGVFETFFLTPVPFFKVRERFVLGGAESKQSRRDLRGGKQTGKAWLQGDKIVAEIAWGPKQAGSGKEEFWVDGNGQLNVKSTVTVNGQSSTTIQVYTRQDNGAADSRYYAPKQDIPFGIDPNTLSEGLLGNFLK